MKKLILISNLFFLLASCSPKSEKTISEMELLNDIFIELVGTEYYYEKLPFPPMPLEYAENKQDSLNFIIGKEKFDKAFDKPKLETEDLIIGIEPYHLNPKREFKFHGVEKACRQKNATKKLYCKQRSVDSNPFFFENLENQPTSKMTS